MKNKKLFFISILGILFLIIMSLVIFGKLDFFDQYFYELVRKLESQFFDNYFVFVTRLGNTLSIGVVVMLFMLLFRNKNSIVLGLLAMNSAFSNTLIKHIIRRERPIGLKLVEQGGYSFPSGHTMIAVAVYGYLLYLVFTKITNKYLKYGLSILLSILIISIGISRVYVGVHFMSDVVAGFILSIIQVVLLIDFTNKHYIRGN